MRLRRLDLTRYGRFTDDSIDFGPATAGAPDLHVVYGPNEAGKSTALAAYLDLLFGIETRSRYNFRHPYETMRIGAVLETEAGPQAFIRIKKRQASLLDAGEHPLPEAALLGALGGLDRASYQAMFCLDDDTLEAGGRGILESRGELGQLLFAASAGLAELSQTLERLRTEADQFHRPYARASTLVQLKAQLVALRAEREQLDTVASQHHQLAARRDADLAVYEAARAAQMQQRTRIETLQRQLAALPHLLAVQRLRAELDGLADLPAPPAGWAAELPQLQRDDVELATRAAGIEAEIIERTARRDAIVLDSAAGLASRFEDLAEARARHVTADLDIPSRRAELLAAEAAIAAVLARLGREGETDPGRLVLPAKLAAKLERLAADRSGIAARLALAQREHSAALQRLTEARQAAQQAGGGDPQRETRLRHLAAAATALRDSDHAIRHRAAERSLAAARLRLDGALAALRPWTGTPAELAGMTVPDAARIARWSAAVDAAQRDADAQAARLAALDAEIAGLQDERAAMGAELGLITDQEAKAVRAARDTAWAAHRLRLEADSADAFAAAMRRDDAAMAARLGHQADAARLRQLAQTLATRTAERQRVDGLLRANSASRATLAAEIAETVAAGLPGLPGTLTPAALDAWLARRAAALDICEQLGLAEAERQAAEQDGARLAAALRDALARLDLSPDPQAPALLAAAEAALAEAATHTALRDAVGKAQTDVAERAHALQAAAHEDTAWNAAWAAACAACWLGGADPIPDPDEAAALLLAARELPALLQQRRDLATRIAAMTEDQARFADQIAALAAQLDLPPEASPLLLADRLAARIQAAREAEALHVRAVAELAASHEQRRTLAQAQAGHAARKTAMLEFFAVATLDEVADRLRAVARKAELQQRAAEAAATLADTLGSPADPATEAMLAALSRDALQAELQGLRAEAEAQDAHLRELFARSRDSSEKIAAIGGDDAVARIELRRQTTLLEIEQATTLHLRLRAGILATEMALGVYREQHRSEMMARAGAAFATISRGAYSGLASRAERDSEVLIALGADGTSKLADDLSKGTRFQLYLALRAAGYQEFAAVHRAVPFIADDIMETFDDLRAEETFRVLGDMARVGQVIYLTHHRHLCDIVKTVVPQARLHTLPA
ncbi:MAG TPA: AAA family ATPase [Acetobacteraceae bacterium]|nr:AAA family ATPase [Acetobacteraceae bacterium]